MTTTIKTANKHSNKTIIDALDFDVRAYVACIASQKETETLLKGLATSAKAAHLAFYNSIRNTEPMELVTIKERAMSRLQAASTTWSKTGDKLDGYQKAAKNGCIEATTYNRFTAWTVTNIALDGHILTADEKTAKAATDKTAKTAKAAKELQATIDQTIADLNLVDAGSMVELTDDICIKFLVARGYTVMAPK